MKTTFTITMADPKMIQEGLFYKITFSNKDHKDSFLGATKTIEQAIEFTKERMDNLVKDIILIDHRSCTFRSMNQSKGGSKSKRKINPEQQAKLQDARRVAMAKRYEYQIVHEEDFQPVVQDGSGNFKTMDECFTSSHYDMGNSAILRSTDNGDFTHYWNIPKQRFDRIC